jgi:hypothetical protein
MIVFSCFTSPNSCGCWTNSSAVSGVWQGHAKFAESERAAHFDALFRGGAAEHSNDAIMQLLLQPQQKWNFHFSAKTGESDLDALHNAPIALQSDVTLISSTMEIEEDAISSYHDVFGFHYRSEQICLVGTLNKVFFFFFCFSAFF